MTASQYGYLEVVRTLLEAGALVKAKTNVRNQMMMIIIMIILLTILIMMLIMMIEDRCIYVKNR